MNGSGGGTTAPSLYAGSGGAAHAAAHEPSAPPAGATDADTSVLADLARVLREPLDADDVRFRVVGGGKQAAYVAADTVVHIANSLFGFQRWSDEVRKIEVDYCVQDGDKRWNVGAHCLMRVYFILNGRPVCWREDLGYGAASRQPFLEAALELARKSAITDARKRCLRLFGEALGGCVANEEFQRSVKEAKAAASSGAKKQQQFSSASTPLPPPVVAGPMSVPSTAPTASGPPPPPNGSYTGGSSGPAGATAPAPHAYPRPTPPVTYAPPPAQSSGGGAAGGTATSSSNGGPSTAATVTRYTASSLLSASAEPVNGIALPNRSQASTAQSAMQSAVQSAAQSAVQSAAQSAVQSAAQSAAQSAVLPAALAPSAAPSVPAAPNAPAVPPHGARVVGHDASGAGHTVLSDADLEAMFSQPSVPPSPAPLNTSAASGGSGAGPADVKSPTAHSVAGVKRGRSHDEPVSPTSPAQDPSASSAPLAMPGISNGGSSAPPAVGNVLPGARRPFAHDAAAAAAFGGGGSMPRPPAAAQHVHVPPQAPVQAHSYGAPPTARSAVSTGAPPAAAPASGLAFMPLPGERPPANTARPHGYGGSIYATAESQSMPGSAAAGMAPSFPAVMGAGAGVNGTPPAAAGAWQARSGSALSGARNGA